jgi:hypothetical protein
MQGGRRNHNTYHRCSLNKYIIQYADATKSCNLCVAVNCCVEGEEKKGLIGRNSILSAVSRVLVAAACGLIERAKVALNQEGGGKEVSARRGYGQQVVAWAWP